MVTNGQVLLFATAVAVIVTPNAAIAAIFSSKILSNDAMIVAADPRKLNVGKIEESRSGKEM